MNVRDVLNAACEHHGIEVARVLGGKRSKLCSVVRAQTITLAREFTCASHTHVCEALQLSMGSSIVQAKHRHTEAMRDARSPYAQSFRAIRNQLQKRIES